MPRALRVLLRRTLTDQHAGAGKPEPKPKPRFFLQNRTETDRKLKIQNRNNTTSLVILCRVETKPSQVGTSKLQNRSRVFYWSLIVICALTDKLLSRYSWGFMERDIKRHGITKENKVEIIIHFVPVTNPKPKPAWIKYDGRDIHVSNSYIIVYLKSIIRNYSIAGKRGHWSASEDISLPYLTLPYDTGSGSGR